MKEYPKNRIDLILSESISGDIRTIVEIREKYRGIDKVEELNKVVSDFVRLIKEVNIL